MNRGEAIATEVQELIREIKERVRESRGVSLEEEIVILGEREKGS